MSLFRTQLLTALLTLALGAGIVASWLHFRPLEIPRFLEVLQWPVHRDAEPGNIWLRNMLRETAAHLPLPTRAD